MWERPKKSSAQFFQRVLLLEEALPEGIFCSNLRSTPTHILSNRSQSFRSNRGVWKFGQFSSAPPTVPEATSDISTLLNSRPCMQHGPTSPTSHPSTRVKLQTSPIYFAMQWKLPKTNRHTTAKSTKCIKMLMQHLFPSSGKPSTPKLLPTLKLTPNPSSHQFRAYGRTDALMTEKLHEAMKEPWDPKTMEFSKLVRLLHDGMWFAQYIGTPITAERAANGRTVDPQVRPHENRIQYVEDATLVEGEVCNLEDDASSSK
jgi:hypothetical protein